MIDGQKDPHLQVFGADTREILHHDVFHVLYLLVNIFMMPLEIEYRIAIRTMTIEKDLDIGENLFLLPGEMFLKFIFVVKEEFENHLLLILVTGFDKGVKRRFKIAQGNAGVIGMGSVKVPDDVLDIR